MRIHRQNLPILAWTFALWLSAIVVGGLLAGRLPSPWIVGGLAVLAAVAERQSVPLTRNTEASVAFLPFVFAAVAFGPFAALVVGALAGFADFRRPYLRWAVYLPVRALTAAAAGLAASQVSASADRNTLGEILLATFVASITNLGGPGRPMRSYGPLRRFCLSRICCTRHLSRFWSMAIGSIQ
jgi:hypothetical protein